MKKTVLSMLIAVTLCFLAGQSAGIAYAESMEQGADQEMQQEMPMPSNTESGQEMQQGDVQSGQGTDQDTGLTQSEPEPSDAQ